MPSAAATPSPSSQDEARPALPTLGRAPARPFSRHKVPHHVWTRS